MERKHRTGKFGKSQVSLAPWFLAWGDRAPASTSGDVFIQSGCVNWVTATTGRVESRNLNTVYKNLPQQEGTQAPGICTAKTEKADLGHYCCGD